ncbi:MAG TPA: hypothetical protein VM261_36530 [Kofleriaceae bacterium]|nr:hypothetical protein [Kofleriaceae bacterium]
MTRLNPWTIREVNDNAVGWISGRIIGAPPLVAPYSKRPCFCYRAFVEGTGDSRESVDELMIADDTGRAIIELAGATIQVELDHTSQGPSTKTRDGRTIEGPVRREGILGPDELIAVHGACRWEMDPRPEQTVLYRDPAPRRLRVTGGPRIQLWVTERL